MNIPDFSYGIVLYWSGEDVAYVANVPELPDCLSDGETRAEVFESVIRAWIGTARKLGREVPAPKGRRLHFA